MKNLEPVVQLNSLVKKISMESQTNQARLVVTDQETGEQRTEGPFDLVIYSSLASETSIPKFPGQDEFQGKQMHSMDFKAKDFQDVIDQQQKVLVLGGSKAGADMVLNFVRCQNYENYVWAYRKPYQFLKFEAISHHRSCVSMLRGFLLLVAFFVSLVWPTGMMMIGWAFGLFCTFGDHGPQLDPHRFHGGILCAKQREDLLQVPKKCIRAGAGITKLTKTGVELTTGEHVECDAVIYATGNSTGMELIELEKDGKPFKLTGDMQLFNHFIVPRFPVLASNSNNFITFGPVRGYNVAELATYHLCVRQKLDEAYMERKASAQWSKNGPLSSFLWSSQIPSMKNWLLLHLDLVLSGIIPVFHWFRHFVELFILGFQTPVEYKLLPSSPYSGPGRRADDLKSRPLLSADP